MTARPLCLLRSRVASARRRRICIQAARPPGAGLRRPEALAPRSAPLGRGPSPHPHPPAPAPPQQHSCTRWEELAGPSSPAGSARDPPTRGPATGHLRLRWAPRARRPDTKAARPRRRRRLLPPAAAGDLERMRRRRRRGGRRESGGGAAGAARLPRPPPENIPEGPGSLPLGGGVRGRGRAGGEERLRADVSPPPAPSLSSPSTPAAVRPGRPHPPCTCRPSLASESTSELGKVRRPKKERVSEGLTPGS